MAKRPLKVFRTSAGFEDVYVAAPSRKAALAAWGTDKDLFEREVTEEVHDPKLTAAALARPGEVVRVPRGTTAQHLSAAGKPLKRELPNSAIPKPHTPKPRARQPKPSRVKLENARQRLNDASHSYDIAFREIERQMAELADKRDSLRIERDRTLKRLKVDVAKEQEAYSVALDAWEG
ncbi:hypothetical protein HHL27_17420 [Novosphingobium sp. TW-4]|uniref:Cell envelope biogenesis protein TolA n=2 Tax=Novosphingobium olei TaxID=2728851 RepID=A0A7Y0BS13_9SPHN|nr:hypothetical protein [Novosphingobium olei]